ncbi:MAG: hypothetical protein PHV39_06185 [Methanomicrobium sp.]|nr:hypothetical protein [Methanomicrobium sp.]
MATKLSTVESTGLIAEYLNIDLDRLKFEKEKEVDAIRNAAQQEKHRQEVEKESRALLRAYQMLGKDLEAGDVIMQIDGKIHKAGDPFCKTGEMNLNPLIHAYKTTRNNLTSRFKWIDGCPGALRAATIDKSILCTCGKKEHTIRLFISSGKN